MVKVFDEGMRGDVLKALETSEFDINCSVEGKDIKVKIQTSKKEHMDAALKKVRKINEEFKRGMKDVRH